MDDKENFYVLGKRVKQVNIYGTIVSLHLCPNVNIFKCEC